MLRSTAIMPTTMRSSMRVNPLLRMEVLGDAVDRRDDRNGDKAHKQSHEYHQRWLNQRREILGEVLDLALVHVGEVDERLRERAALLPDSDHVGKDVGENFFLLLQERRYFLAAVHDRAQLYTLLLVDEIFRRVGGDWQGLGEPHAALEQEPERATNVGDVVILQHRADDWCLQYR